MRTKFLFLLACIAGRSEAQTLSISPKSATVAVGATKQFTRSSTAKWTSSDTSIATVSSVGVVTAKRSGQALICVTVGGPSACAIVTVPAVVVAPPPDTQPTPTPIPTSGSNEPAGMTVLVNRPFNSLTESQGWLTNKLTIAQDASAPESPSGVLRATYPAGFSGGSSPGTAEFSHAGHRVIYISYWAKLSANFWGHLTGVNKQLYEWGNGNGIFYFEAAGVGSGSLTPRVVLQGTPADAVLSPNLVPTARIPRGVWYHVEIVLNGNSSGSADGSVDWWLDGVHIASYSGRQFTSGATSWGIFQFQPVWGGVTDVVPATMTLDLDHLHLSGKN